MTQTHKHPIEDSSEPHLKRRFGLLQSTALNMTNMVGIGPFITIPLLMSALGGPPAMLGWLLAMLTAIPDGMVWSELGAALPGSGGSYVFLREAYGREKFGRLMAFLFIWQFLLSGPLEIASGFIGFAKYLQYVWPGMTPLTEVLVAMAVGATTLFLLYRRIGAVAKITVTLWAGTLLTTGAVIVSGVFHFDPAVAFEGISPNFQFSWGFLLGLGAATRVGLYDYLGYYDICYIGDEVRDPGRVIPRAVIISVVGVAVIYVAMNLSIIGVIPWRSFVPHDQHPGSNFVVSLFMEKLYGKGIAQAFTLLILWTTFGSVFALLLGYSRIPFAAARDGYFFRVFGRLHPRKEFPHVSLLFLGAISMICCWLPLGTVIDALLITRILVQFVGQIFGVILLRRTRPDLPRPYRIWFYPVPCLVALAGWLFVFVTSDWRIVTFGLGTLLLGVGFFVLWSWRTGKWPFSPLGADTARPVE